MSQGYFKFRDSIRRLMDQKGFLREPEATKQCRRCEQPTVLTPSDCFCRNCGYNYFWNAKKWEAYTGPMFKPQAQRLKQ